MTDYSSLTKAGLLEEIGRLKDRIENPPRRESPPLAPVPEAVALSGCIRALDQIPNLSRNGYTSNVGPEPATVTRVLRALADRYQVPLVEIKHEPCDRRHVDQIDADAISYAIQNALGGSK